MNKISLFLASQQVSSHFQDDVERILYVMGLVVLGVIVAGFGLLLRVRKNIKESRNA